MTQIKKLLLHDENSRRAIQKLRDINVEIARVTSEMKSVSPMVCQEANGQRSPIHNLSLNHKINGGAQSGRRVGLCRHERLLLLYLRRMSSQGMHGYSANNKSCKQTKKICVCQHSTLKKKGSQYPANRQQIQHLWACAYELSSCTEQPRFRRAKACCRRIWGGLQIRRRKARGHCMHAFILGSMVADPVTKSYHRYQNLGSPSSLGSLSKPWFSIQALS